MAVANKKRKIFDGRYEVLSIVGRGACSVVYHARNAMSPNSEVALKVLVNQRGGTSNTDRLRKEALAMVSSRHKYVVRLDDFHSVQDLCYLSMEYAREGDLRKYAAKIGGRLPLEQAQLFFRQASEALNFVHRVGITHRDIKPDNILVLSDNEIRLTDFGVAVLPGERASLDDLQQGVGTMSYMAPEVLEGKNCDKLSDIYSLGVTFYEMITGTHPFENVPLAKQLDIRRDENVPPLAGFVPKINPGFAAIITRCMRYNPEKRFATVSDILKALDQAENKESGDETAANPKRRQRISTRGGRGRRASKQNLKSRPAQFKKPEVFDRPAKTTKPERPAPPPASTRAEEEYTEEDLDKEIDEILNELEEEARSKRTESRAPSDLSPSKPEEEPPPPAEEPEILDSTQPTEQEEDKNDDFYIEEDPNDVVEPAPHKYLRDPRVGPKKYSDKPKFAAGADYEIHSDRSNPSFLALFITALLIIYTGNFLLDRIFGITIFGSSSDEVIINEPLPTIIPLASPRIDAFPALREGTFYGRIYDIIPGQESPLVIISLPEQQALIVIVGVEGWTPTMVVLPADAAENPPPSIRVTSNGIVLDLQGEVIEGEVHGEYTNAVNGTRGKWQLGRLEAKQ